MDDKIAFQQTSQEAWDQALEAAASAARLHEQAELATLIEAMRGEENRKTIILAMRADEDEMAETLDQGLSQAIADGHMRDNGDGTFSLTPEGIRHVEGMLPKDRDV